MGERTPRAGFFGAGTVENESRTAAPRLAGWTARTSTVSFSGETHRVLLFPTPCVRRDVRGLADLPTGLERSQAAARDSVLGWYSEGGETHLARPAFGLVTGDVELRCGGAGGRAGQQLLPTQRPVPRSRRPNGPHPGSCGSGISNEARQTEGSRPSELPSRCSCGHLLPIRVRARVHVPPLTTVSI
jgi:hypothetical protein